jgi:hypothetical protein
VSLVGQWQELQAELSDEWRTAELRLDVRDRDETDRAAALLGPVQPFRAAPTTLRFSAARDGTAPSPDSIARLLRRADNARVIGKLGLAGLQEAPAREERPVTTLVQSWDGALATLPPDWSDLYAELRLSSSDYVDRASVLCAPLNPRRDGKRTALRFRAARLAGYGASPAITRRCLERCDEESMRGAVEILQALSDTKLVATQGPTWLGGGKNV